MPATGKGSANMGFAARASSYLGHLATCWQAVGGWLAKFVVLNLLQGLVVFKLVGSAEVFSFAFGFRQEAAPRFEAEQCAAGNLPHVLPTSPQRTRWMRSLVLALVGRCIQELLSLAPMLLEQQRCVQKRNEPPTRKARLPFLQLLPRLW